MRSSSLPSGTLAFATLCTISKALPLFHLEIRDPNPAPLPLPQAYSVVPVDGGASGVAATKTITNVVTQTQVQTLISTITTGGSESVVTRVTTEFVPTTVIQTVPVTVTEAETQTMVVEPGVTSVPFDNGMWHTTYYYRSTLSDVFVPAASATPSPSRSRVNAEVVTPLSSTITPAPQRANPITASAAAPTTTDWAHYYGTWHESPKNGSWWGKRLLERPAAALARLSW